MVSTLGLCIDRSGVAQQDILRECPKFLIPYSISQQFFFNSTTRIMSVLAFRQLNKHSVNHWLLGYQNHKLESNQSFNKNAEEHSLGC